MLGSTISLVADVVSNKFREVRPKPVEQLLLINSLRIEDALSW